MDYLNTLGAGILGKGETVFTTIMAYLPKFLVAVVIALIGYFIALALKKITIKIAKKLKVDSLISKTNLDEQLEDAGVKMNISTFLGGAVKWIILIITLLFITGMFESLEVVQTFISEILLVIGRIIVALFIFAIAVYAARFTGAIAKAVANYIDVKNTKLISDIVKAVIYFFAFIQILTVLNVDGVVNIILGFLQATFYGIALAVGIAFGLGGQEKAKEVIAKCKK